MMSKRLAIAAATAAALVIVGCGGKTPDNQHTDKPAALSESVANSAVTDVAQDVAMDDATPIVVVPGDTDSRLVGYWEGSSNACGTIFLDTDGTVTYGQIVMSVDAMKEKEEYEKYEEEAMARGEIVEGEVNKWHTSGNNLIIRRYYNRELKETVTYSINSSGMLNDGQGCIYEKN